LRTVAIVAVAAALAASALAGERSSGVFVFTAPDGTRRVINVPAAGWSVAAVPDGLTERRQQLWPAVQETSRGLGLDPNLVDLVIRMESGYDARAVSRKGARGVMQLMPDTASLYGVRNVFDPLQNIRGGVRYLRDLLQRFDSNVALALAAYNAGPEAVARHGGVPPYDETRSYVKTILAAYGSGEGFATLSGGFGRRARPLRPVELVGDAGAPLISNARRPGEAAIAHTLALR
jgi:soluble lytic murein transglycosylase-like protein